MALHLMLAVLAEDPGSIPSTHMVVHHKNSSSPGIQYILWPLRALHLHTERDIFKNNNNNNFKIVESNKRYLMVIFVLHISWYMQMHEHLYMSLCVCLRVHTCACSGMRLHVCAGTHKHMCKPKRGRQNSSKLFLMAMRVLVVKLIHNKQEKNAIATPTTRKPKLPVSGGLARAQMISVLTKNAFSCLSILPS